MPIHTADLTNLKSNQGDVHRNEAVESDYDTPVYSLFQTKYEILESLVITTRKE